MQETLNKLQLIIDTELARKLRLTTPCIHMWERHESISGLVDISNLIVGRKSTKGTPHSILQRFLMPAYGHTISSFINHEEKQKVEKIFIGLYIHPNNENVYAVVVLDKGEEEYQVVATIGDHMNATDGIGIGYFPLYGLLSGTTADSILDDIAENLKEALLPSVVEEIIIMRDQVMRDIMHDASTTVNLADFEALLSQSVFSKNLHGYVMSKENKYNLKSIALPVESELYKTGKSMLSIIPDEKILKQSLSTRHAQTWKHIKNLLQDLYNEADIE